MAKAQVEKAKEKAEKTRDEAKQHGYDFGMVEIEDTLRTEVPRVRRLYCAQVWDEALNQAGVEASFVLRKAENIYYPEAIRPPSSSSYKADIPLEVADPEKIKSEKALTSSGNPLKVAERPGVNEKEAEVTKGVLLDATKPPAVPYDPTKDNKASKMEIVLATLLIPTKGDPKGTDKGSLKVVAQQSKVPPLGKIVIKKK